MKPTSPIVPGMDLPEVNIARYKPEYRTLPAVRVGEDTIVTRWRMSWRERLRVLATGNIYLWIMHYGKPIQPVLLEACKPEPEVFDLAPPQTSLK